MTAHSLRFSGAAHCHVENRTAALHATGAVPALLSSPSLPSPPPRPCCSQAVSRRCTLNKLAQAGSTQHSSRRPQCAVRSKRAGDSFTRLRQQHRLSRRHQQQWQAASLDGDSESGSSSSPAGGVGTSTLARASEQAAEEQSLEQGSAAPPAAKEQGTKSEEAAKATKDVLALRSLDAYFEKLKGLQPPEEHKLQPKAEVKAEAMKVGVADLAPPEAGAKQRGKVEQEGGSEKGELAKSEEEKEAEEEMMLLLKKLLDAKASEQPGDGSKEEPRVVFSASIGMQSDYERWVDAQLLVNPTSAAYILLAINAAVFLFELASPEAVPGLLVTSLPSLLGAKVHALISAGEWWRLVTPMFLHAGFFHILLGSLVLASVGPAVEVAFGSLGFVAAYLVGGVFGNLMSFLQTADVTVGGTGPLYGMVAAYLVYLYRNRDAIGKDEAQGSMGSLIFFAALNVALGNDLPIDDWTHIGAALGGLAFGLLACPRLEKLNLGPSKDPSSIEDAGTLFFIRRPERRQQALALAACLGVAALLLQFSSAGIPDHLLDISGNLGTTI